MFRRLLVTVAVLAIGASVVGVADAQSPFKFSNRVLFERSAARQFERVIRNPPGGLQPLAVRVQSIGCAKLGFGKAECVINSYSRDTGRLIFTFRLTCRDDRGRNCRYRLRQSWQA